MQGVTAVSLFMNGERRVREKENAKEGERGKEARGREGDEQKQGRKEGETEGKNEERKEGRNKRRKEGKRGRVSREDERRLTNNFMLSTAATSSYPMAAQPELAAFLCRTRPARRPQNRAASSPLTSTYQILVFRDILRVRVSYIHPVGREVGRSLVVSGRNWQGCETFAAYK